VPEQGGIDRQIILPEFRRREFRPLQRGREMEGIANLHKAQDDHERYHEQERTAIAAGHDDLARRLNELCEFHQFSFYADNVAASQTDVALLGPPSTRGYVAGEDGSICTIAIRCNDARTAGSFTVTPRVNGVKAAFSLTIDATNTTVNYDRQNQGIDTFVAGDLIDCVISSTSAWLPVTADIDVSVGVVLFAGVR